MSEPVLLGLDAMRTHFEVVLHGAEPALLSAAGAEALEEIRSVEAQLSIFRSDSWLSRLNADGPRGDWVRVPAPLFQLLTLCVEVHGATDGAFDPAAAAQLDAHGLRDHAPRWETPGELTGSLPTLADLELRAPHEVRFRHPQLRLDLGGIGKGWALDRAAEVLTDAGVPGFLLHGGTSTLRTQGAPVSLAGRPAGVRGWCVGVEPFACVELRDAALSVSASRSNSKSRAAHVIDPATGQPLRSRHLSAVCAPDATRADAWSTALLVQSQAPFSWKSLS